MYTIQGHFPLKDTVHLQKSSENGALACEKSSSSATHARRKKSRIAPSRTAATAAVFLRVAATRVYFLVCASMYSIPGHFSLKHTALLQKSSEHGSLAC